MATSKRDAERATTHGDFGANYGRARSFAIAGTAVMSIGATLAIAGIVRLAIVKNRARKH